MIYGYARTSTKKQKIQSQIETLLENGAEKIIQEQFSATGTDRVEWNNLKNIAKSGDTIIFYSINRMSRNAAEGHANYFDLVDRGVNLEFILEAHLNSKVFKEQLEASKLNIEVDKTLEPLIKGLEETLRRLAARQIEIAFEQAEKEAKDIVIKVKNGILRSNKKSGRSKGYVSTKKKNIPADFEKTMKQLDNNVSKLARHYNVSRPTIYSWKNEIHKLRRI